MYIYKIKNKLYKDNGTTTKGKVIYSTQNADISRKHGNRFFK